MWVSPQKPTHSYQPLKAYFQCYRSTYSAKVFWKANTPRWKVFEVYYSYIPMQMVLHVIYPSKQFPLLSLLTSLIAKLIILKAFLSHLQTVYFSPCDLKQRVYAYRTGLPVGILNTNTEITICHSDLRKTFQTFRTGRGEEDYISLTAECWCICYFRQGKPSTFFCTSSAVNSPQVHRKRIKHSCDNTEP